MTPEHWAKVEELYHAARATQPADRGAFLEQACGDDSGLRKEIESLLVHAPDSNLVSENFPRAHVLAEGAELGHYRVGARLGAGGMGEVYRGIDNSFESRCCD